MKYLKKFENEEAKNAWLNGSEYVTPNVALTEGVVEYNLQFNPADVPLYVEATENATISFSNTYEHSKDNATWSSGTSETSISAKAGERVYFRASLTPIITVGIGRFSIADGKCNVGGNIMSMAYGANFKGQTSMTNSQFYGLFYGCKTIVDASKLVLPASVAVGQCYRQMFYSCTSLISAPELPATTVSSQCYCEMFYACTSLMNAPALPATSLADNCYGWMFYSCTSLELAPVLPAEWLKTTCYRGMFKNCKSLRYIKAMFTDTPNDDTNGRWVENISPSGTFVKNAAATWDVVGTSGIPEGWTIEYAES